MPETSPMMLDTTANTTNGVPTVAEDKPRAIAGRDWGGRTPKSPGDATQHSTGSVSEHPNGNGEYRQPIPGLSSDVGGDAGRTPAMLPSEPSGAPAERVLIVDDCTLFRENLAATLAAQGITVAGEAWDLTSLLMVLREVDASLVLLNLVTCGSRLLLQAAREVTPGVRVIVFGTSEDDESEIIACAEAGVDGYHMRRDSLEDLVSLIHSVAAGKPLCPPRVSAVLLGRLSMLAHQAQPMARGISLTARETQILKMLELGRSNRDIATLLDIAVHTVKKHVHNLLTKLGVSTRAEAAALARTVRSERDVRRD